MCTTLGRTTNYTEYNTNGTTLLTRVMIYDAANRVIDETDTTNGTIKARRRPTARIS